MCFGNAMTSKFSCWNLQTTIKFLRTNLPRMMVDFSLFLRKGSRLEIAVCMFQDLAVGFSNGVITFRSPPSAVLVVYPLSIVDDLRRRPIFFSSSLRCARASRARKLMRASDCFRCDARRPA